MKNSMHLDAGKHPFQASGKTPKPKMAKSQGAHPTQAGSVGKFRSANASMKGKK